MIPVDAAIARFRRDLTLSMLIRFVMGTAALASILAGPLFGLHGDGTIMLMILGAVWLVLTYQSLKGTRLSVDSPALIAAGEYDRAEQHIDDALRSFSLFRSAKLLSMQHLALLRHAQHRWRESALLCQAILRQKIGNIEGLGRTTLLLMADSMLQLGDLNGVYSAMGRLQSHRLSLGENLSLQLMQLDYGSRISAWDAMLDAVGVKVQMSELMPAINAARSQSYLALAAYKKGRLQLAKWLRGRAELLANPGEIIQDRPVLGEMFQQIW